MATSEQDPTPTDHRDSPDFEASWATFLQSRQSLREVMNDDELRAFGINLDAYDRKPEAGDFQ